MKFRNACSVFWFEATETCYRHVIVFVAYIKMSVNEREWVDILSTYKAAASFAT